MNDFVILGLANCYIRNEDNQLEPIQVIEPVPSAAFLTLLHNIPSSYSILKAFHSNEVTAAIAENTSVLGFPDEAKLATDFEERLDASIKTYEHNPDATGKLKIGQSIKLSNPSTHKRILNPKRTVKTSDNVKQHSHANTRL